MATTKIWDVRGWLGQVVNYVENPEKTENMSFSEADIQGLRDVMNYATQDYKTEQQFFVSGINCLPETARQQMLLTKKHWAKEGGIVAFHGYQSFAPGEVTPELAHEIGMKLAKELWGDRFEVIVTTHLDKAHLHSHFVLNSVSFRDGKRYNDCKASYTLMRLTSDRLCKEYKLSVIKQPQYGNQRSYDAWQADRDGKPTWWSLVRSDVDQAIRQSMTYTQFIRNLHDMGYEVKQGKHLAIRPEGKERFVRLKTLGTEYSEEAIKQRILRQRQPERILQPFHPAMNHARYIGSLKHRQASVKGLRALYLHYIYLLRRVQRQPTQKASFRLREDIRKLDEITVQTKLLCRHRIDTKEQLEAFIERREAERVHLVSRRKTINNRKRRTIAGAGLEELQIQSKEITSQIAEIRMDNKVANEILSRSIETKNKPADNEHQKEDSSKQPLPLHQSR